MHCIAGTTISRRLGTRTTPAEPPTSGRMWSQQMTSSALLDSTAPALYRSSLVVVGNPIYLMFPTFFIDSLASCSHQFYSSFILAGQTRSLCVVIVSV